LVEVKTGGAVLVVACLATNFVPCTSCSTLGAMACGGGRLMFGGTLPDLVSA
jgi:hypothetical protein